MTAGLVETITNVVATIAIALFAGLQWWLTKQAEARRQAERAEDRQRDDDTAYATLNAEWFRIWAVAQEWRSSDLTNPALIASMSPDDILPRAWSSSTTHLGRLGALTAQLAGMGLALAYDAGRAARALFGEAQIYHREMPEEPAASKAFMAEHLPRLRGMEEAVKQLAEEAALVLEDSMNLSPPASRQQRVEFDKASLKSTTAKQLLGGIESDQAPSDTAKLLFGRLRIEPKP